MIKIIPPKESSDYYFVFSEKENRLIEFFHHRIEGEIVISGVGIEEPTFFKIESNTRVNHLFSEHEIIKRNYNIFYADQDGHLKNLGFFNVGINGRT